MKHVLAILAFVGSAPADADPLIASGVDLAVAPRALDRVPDTAPTIVATKAGIVIEGKAIVAIANGDVDPSEKDGGALGLKIRRITAFMQALAANARTPIDVANVVIDQSLPYRLAMEILFSAKSAPMKHFALMAKTSAGLGVVPLALPEKRPPDKSEKPGALKLVVAITKDKILLWSISGLEGTLQAPKLGVAPGQADKLTPALAEIVKRRFKGKRDAVDRQILVMADGAIPMKDVMAVIFAIRTAADGSELFPDILLASGFE